MVDALVWYIEHMFAVCFALIATGLVILLACCVGMMLYALYKGATDPAWRK